MQINQSIMPKALLCLFACLALLACESAIARPPDGREPPVNDSHVNPDHRSRVSIRVEEGRRIIESNGIPDHTTGRFPGPGNPNAIMEQDYHFAVTTDPQAAARPRSIQGWIFGVAVDGVIFDPGTADYWRGERGSIWHVEGIIDGRRTLGIDWSDAHVQPNGAYHYHGIPWGVIEAHHAQKKMFLVGWAADGYPIYGPWAYKDAKDSSSPVVLMKPSYRLKKGERPGGDDGPGGVYDGTYEGDYEYVKGLGDLDACNGRTGVTPEFPKGTYYYVVTETFPLVPRYFHGTPDSSFRHPFDPVRGRGPGGRRRLGPPPRD